MDRTTCHLAFRGRCLEAFEHYAELLGGSVEEVCLLAAHSPAVASAVLRVEEWRLTGHDQDGDDGAGHEVALVLCTEDGDEAWRLYRRLALDGQVTTPMGETRWARLAGGLIDRYGTPWILCHGIHDGTARLLVRRPRMALDVLPLDCGLAAGGQRARPVLHQQAEDEEVPVFMHQEIPRASAAEVVRRP